MLRIFFLFTQHHYFAGLTRQSECLTGLGRPRCCDVLTPEHPQHRSGTLLRSPEPPGWGPGIASEVQNSNEEAYRAWGGEEEDRHFERCRSENRRMVEKSCSSSSEVKSQPKP